MWIPGVIPQDVRLLGLLRSHMLRWIVTDFIDAGIETLL